jgi:outer membrane protein
MAMRQLIATIILIIVHSLAVSAQLPKQLTLKDAQAIALDNHPQIGSAQFRAKAANQVITQFRAAQLPTFFTSMTVAGAGDNERIAAGGLNNPTILSRYSNGISMSQLLTDFGRTKNLIKSSQLHATAQERDVDAAKADVLLQVDQAYYNALSARAVLQVAEETVKERQVVFDQVSALAKSKLKSALDVSFANVNLSEAQLLLLKAQNDLKAANANLSLALGFPNDQDFDLSEEPLPADASSDLAGLIDEAIKNRPELASLQLDRDAAFKFAKAEKALNLPTISMVTAAGYTPIHVDGLSNHYTAGGINISIPVFTGHLFSARQAEANFKAQAADKDVAQLQNRIVRDVKLAWLNAQTAQQRLDLTAKLLDQAALSLDLAKTRYDLQLSSIVELNQAQLNMTQAEIDHARAKYDYQSQRALLDYQVGLLR